GWASAVGARLLIVDLDGWRATRGGPGSEALVAASREALLRGAALVLRGLDTAMDRRPDAPLHMASVRQVLENHPTLTFLLGSARWEPSTCWANRQSLSIKVDELSAAARSRLWTTYLDERFPPETAGELGKRYRLVGDEPMRAVAQGALGRASLRGEAQVSLSDALDAARTVSSPALGELARRVETQHTWADIVLPADGVLRLRELCARFRHRATVYESWGYADSALSRPGVAALFVGLPGTGKTMAAEIIAAELTYDLYRVDLSAIVSKYIGETEKNLEAIFYAAEQGEVVLLFDEADALFGKRSEVRDAHDRYANIEVAYLLQRLETYSGLAILTSNLTGNLDEAFLRRLDAVVEFPFPEEDERREIWRRSLPDSAPRADDVDFGYLARTFKLTGGHIRNSALTAAFLAADEGEPIAHRHLLHAIRREYEKVGKLPVDLPPASRR
ncbi:MAG: ATP-binding protein, partial [Chloroflexi bacterium]|nr:ATP-binding protein [Chloroflexota bacterium]